MIWTTIYGYETLGYSKDPDHCYASDNSNFRVTDLHATETEDFVDVGERFSVVFTIAYYSSLTLLVAGILHCIDMKNIRLFARCVGTVVNQVLAVTVITGIVMRMLHTG